jgi:hypothetical protein
MEEMEIEKEHARTHIDLQDGYFGQQEQRTMIVCDVLLDTF